MTKEAEAGGMGPQAKGHLWPPEAGRGRKNFPESLWGSVILPTALFQTLASKPGRGHNFVLSFQLWCFPMAATETGIDLKVSVWPHQSAPL